MDLRPSPETDTALPQTTPKAATKAPRIPIRQPLAAIASHPLILISPFFLWGTAMVAMKGVMAETTPLFLASVRLLPAGLLVVAVSVLLGKQQPQGWRAWLWISLFAFVDGTLFQGFLALGLERTGAGLGSVMIDSQPLAVAIMARFLFQEWIGPLGWLGLGIGLAGISFIGLPDNWILSFFQGNWLDLGHAIPFEQAVWFVLFQQGEWLMLMAALSMALGTILIRYVVRWADPVAATGWHMVLGGLPLMAAALQEWVVASDPIKQGLAPWQSISWSGWLAMGYATVFGSAIAYGVFFYIAAQGNLTSLSALTFLTPVFALLFSTLLLSENLSLLQWCGVLLTLLSIYLINQRIQLAAWLSTHLALPAIAVPPNANVSSKAPD
ncbi:MAG: DMT family transporter [Phormidesmis sp. RL_2_1]|nr:DMT family transporter [Phormidesmis sp. RL_2_1]